MVGRLSERLPLLKGLDLSAFSAETADFNKMTKRIRGQIAGPLLCNLKAGYENRDNELTRRLSSLYGLERTLSTPMLGEETVFKTLQVMADLDIVMGDLSIPKDILGLAIDKPVRVDFRSVHIDKPGKALFAQKVSRALSKNIPLQLVSTVCPGYTHSPDGVYDFKGFTADAGLLGKIHLTCFREVLQPIFQQYAVPYHYQVVVADLSEGFDDDVVRKFAGGDPQQFLKVAQGTAHALGNFAKDLGLQNMEVTTMGEFFQLSYEEYKREREVMIDELIDLAGKNEAFGHIFRVYLEPRRNLYTKFIASEGDTLSECILQKRAANGFAQYFHHFDLLRKCIPEAIVVNHSTNSLRFINGGLVERDGQLTFVEDVGRFGKIKLPIILLETEAY